MNKVVVKPENGPSFELPLWAGLLLLASMRREGWVLVDQAKKPENEKVP